MSNTIELLSQKGPYIALDPSRIFFRGKITNINCKLTIVLFVYTIHGVQVGLGTHRKDTKGIYEQVIN